MPVHIIYTYDNTYCINSKRFRHFDSWVSEKSRSNYRNALFSVPGLDQPTERGGERAAVAMKCRNLVLLA